MWWYRIVYQGLHTLLLEVFLQFVSALAEYRELVIDIHGIIYSLRQGYQRIADVLVIVCCKLLTPVVVFVQVFEFHIEHGSIQFRHSAVHAYVLKHILLLTAVIG